MKKVFVLTASALFLLHHPLHSKTKEKRNIQFVSVGPSLGFGHSWVSGLDQQKFNSALSIGASLIYSKKEHTGFGGDIIISGEGFKMEDPASGEQLQVRPVYLRINPKFYYFFGKYQSVVRPKVFIGPSVGFKLGEKSRFKAGSVPGEGSAMTYNRSEIFNSVELGFNAGAGVNFRLAKSAWLNLDAGYYHGVLDVTGEGHSNRNLKLNAGILFGL